MKKTGLRETNYVAALGAYCSRLEVRLRLLMKLKIYADERLLETKMETKKSFWKKIICWGKVKGYEKMLKIIKEKTAKTVADSEIFAEAIQHQLILR